MHPAMNTRHTPPNGPIAMCQQADRGRIHEIINESAEAYRGVIPSDCWHEPYMPIAELESEIQSGVQFYGYTFDGHLVGVMGIQNVRDVTLIRHAYVRTAQRKHGIGTLLLRHLVTMTDQPILIGTWRAATWAIRFYERSGFTLVEGREKDRLLESYWTVSVRQIEESVVLADWRQV